MMQRLLSGSRYMIIIAILGAFLAATIVLIYGGLTVAGIIIDVFVHHLFTTDGAKHLAIECIEIIDLFLLGTILYIIALGLYDLFIDDHLAMPDWLEIHTLDDLKNKLIGVVIVLLAVTFLGDVVNWDGGNSILSLGIAVGLVLLVLSLLLSRVFKHTHTTKEDRNISSTDGKSENFGSNEEGI
jgi:uncharacterized membrane protein YqhA